MTPPKKVKPTDIIKIAERVRKILYERQVKVQKGIINEDKFPLILEKEAEEFLLNHSLSQKVEESDDTNNMSVSQEDSPKDCYSVKEVDDEEDDDEQHLDQSLNKITDFKDTKSQVELNHSENSEEEF